MADDIFDFEEFKKKHPSAVPIVKLTFPDDTFVFLPPEAWEGFKESSKQPVVPLELIGRIQTQFPLMKYERVVYVANVLQTKGLAGLL